MRVNVKNKEIVIKFEFSRRKSSAESQNQSRSRRTRCYILSGTESMRDNDKAKIGDATVRCDSRDQPDLVAARRAAFAKALKTAVSLDEVEKQYLWTTVPLRKSAKVEFSAETAGKC